MIVRTVTQAKVQPSEIVDAALQGHEAILSRAGRPVVKIVPIGEETRSREPGGLKHLILPDDFDRLDDGIIASFEGGNDVARLERIRYF